MRTAELPAINIYTPDESVDPDSLSSGILRRTLTVAVDVWHALSKPDEVDAAIDDLTLQVETALDADHFLGTLLFSPVLLSSTEIGFATQNTDRPMGVAHLEFSCVYETVNRVAGADPSIGEFKKADVTFLSPAPPAHDAVTVRP